MSSDEEKMGGGEEGRKREREVEKRSGREE